MSFKIIKNKLSSKSFAKSLLVENEYYKIRIFYAGDYDSDKLNNRIDMRNISISCKSKCTCFWLDYLGGSIVINWDGFDILYPKEVEKLINQLDIAKCSAVELEEIINEYFR